MIYVLSWIVVGFCSFLITKSNWEKRIGKYGVAIFAHCRVEGGTDKELSLDKAEEIRKSVNLICALMLTIVAPYSLFIALITSFKNNNNPTVEKVVNEYVSKHGMIF